MLKMCKECKVKQVKIILGIEDGQDVIVSLL